MNILNKIEFHYTYLIVVIISLFAGLFREIITFTTIILVHEMGHLFVSYKYKFEVLKITIYPYGGKLKINSLINNGLKNEFVLAIMGVIFQSVLYFIVIILNYYNIVRDSTFLIFKIYHYSILIFNLLPIYPLDGGKILNIFLNKIFSYYYANILTIILSFFFLVILITLNYNLMNYSYIIILILIISNLINFYKSRKVLFNKFLLERYLYDFNFKKEKIIKNEKRMKKEVRHLFLINDSYMTEKRYLKILFDYY